MVSASHTLASFTEGGDGDLLLRGSGASVVTVDGEGDSSSLAVGFLPPPLTEVCPFPPCKPLRALACSICCPAGVRREQLADAQPAPEALRTSHCHCGQKRQGRPQPASPQNPTHSAFQCLFKCSFPPYITKQSRCSKTDSGVWS